MGNKICFTYDADASPALNDISINVREGEFAVILGPNGCGKSTLARHFNALLPLQAGDLNVTGLDVSQEKNHRLLRRRCGMVFQNPDNQFVSSMVGEDIAFGLENYGCPREELPVRVAAALRLTGLEGFEARSVHTLSGGQKQRAALAGVLALDPKLLLLDEATSMLDPEGRREMLRAVRTLHENKRRTIVMITHYVEEAVGADRIFLMQDGGILEQGPPGEVLTDPALMEKAGLLPPLTVRLYYDLKKAGMELSSCPLTEEDLVRELCQLY